MLTLCAFTGLRKGDALTLTKAAYDAESGGIAANTAKTGQKVQWPVIAPLRAVLDAAPVHDAITLAATSKGRPWSVSGFDTEWQRPRTRLEAEGKIGPGLTLHGLRHSVAHVLAEQGFSLRTIANVLGQSSEAMARHYSRDADLSGEMSKVGEVLNVFEATKATKVSNPGPKSVQPSEGDPTTKSDCIGETKG